MPNIPAQRQNLDSVTFDSLKYLGKRSQSTNKARNSDHGNIIILAIVIIDRYVIIAVHIVIQATE